MLLLPGAITLWALSVAYAVADLLIPDQPIPDSVHHLLLAAALTTTLLWSTRHHVELDYRAGYRDGHRDGAG
ncbi:hypothetical protein [Streptosporangium sp. NPDC051022]|uniref:hypothetical protein n=1 Tax=Streptosporangium sp. NPDC051022 TaxID=3155752 RepID=UPI003421EF2B